MVSLERQPRAAEVGRTTHKVKSPIPTNGKGKKATLGVPGYEGIPPGVVAGVTSPWKRVIDIAACGTAVAILWPVFAAAAVLIKLDSHGPVLVRQRRVGLNGREFDFFKFRTMYHHKTK